MKASKTLPAPKADHERNATALEITGAVIENFKGNKHEFLMLKGLLCAPHSMTYEQQAEFGKFIDGMMVARRMDAIKAAAVLTRTAEEFGVDIAYELEALADALLLECPPGFHGESEADYAMRLALRTKGARIKLLSLAVLTLFSEADNADAVAAVARDVYGISGAAAWLLPPSYRQEEVAHG